MANTDLQIVATDVLYFHPADERTFFGWLDEMSFVADYRGIGRDLFIQLNRTPTYDDLWEIIGFCRRYKVSIQQLEKFVTDENRRWLPDEIAWNPSLPDES